MSENYRNFYQNNENQKYIYSLLGISGEVDGVGIKKIDENSNTGSLNYE